MLFWDLPRISGPVTKEYRAIRDLLLLEGNEQKKPKQFLRTKSKSMIAVLSCAKQISLLHAYCSLQLEKMNFMLDKPGIRFDPIVTT